MPTTQPDDSTCACCCKPPVRHVHRRGWRPCPALFPPPPRPTKAVSRFLFAWASAVQHHETMVEFIQANPSEFPRLAGEA